MPRLYKFEPEPRPGLEWDHSAAAYLQFTRRFPAMDIQDHRPFDTMFRLISSMKAKVYFDQDQLMMRMPNGYLKRVSVTGVLCACMDESKRLCSIAETNFERQCCEEDEEELQMLLDAYHSGVKKEAYQPVSELMSEWPAEIPMAVMPPVVEFSHENDDLETNALADQLDRVILTGKKQVDKDYIPPYLLA